MILFPRDESLGREEVLRTCFFASLAPRMNPWAGKEVLRTYTPPSNSSLESRTSPKDFPPPRDSSLGKQKDQMPAARRNAASFNNTSDHASNSCNRAAVTRFCASRNSNNSTCPARYLLFTIRKVSSADRRPN